MGAWGGLYGAVRYVSRAIKYTVGVGPRGFQEWGPRSESKRCSEKVKKGADLFLTLAGRQQQSRRRDRTH